MPPLRSAEENRRDQRATEPLRPLPPTRDVRVGDRVLFSKYAGTEIKIEGGDHIMLREEDVLGVVEAA